MVEIVISVAAKVAEYLVDPIIRPLGYLFNYHRNITDLNQQIENLHLAREELQIPVNEANRQGDEIFPGVREWLTYAEGIILERNDFNEHERKASKSCFYLKSRYQLSKQAKNLAEDIVLKIQQAHNFGDRVAYRPSPPPVPSIISASSKDHVAFQSRESTFNQIMQALGNENMRMIGVWGMGGVGKTTLVKQVALQAHEDKLFHQVVMASDISQTPNIAEIQGKIANMLGLKFEAEEDRAGRLRQRLKEKEKILVIFDDIWGKLDLRDIGIPDGDDHKGCKVLLTSREHQVLSKDMRTQKEFHLQHLSEDEAWNLFKKTAGDSVENPELRPIAVDVAKKCDGLPVAIVTIANALRGESVHVWENALEELRTAAPRSIRGVSKNVYKCLELSYNHLESDEVKSLFLLCALLGDGDISMDRLLQFAMCLNLFERTYLWEKAINKLITLVENLKASSLLLDHEGDGDKSSSLLFDHAFVRMHDVVRDVARSIASKDPHRFVVREAVGSEEAVELREWQRTDECRNFTRISLICRNMDELPQGLVCPKLEFFLLNSSNEMKIPDAFFQDTKQLRILDLSKVSLTPSPSSLGFLSNLQTLRLNQCQIQDITVIGELKKLQVLSLAESHIEQLPNEVAQLSDLRMLDLQNCRWLKVIPRNVISSLSQLEYLSMKGSLRIEWAAEGFNRGERINACLSELKHLSGLRTLEVQVSNPSLFPEDDVLFENLNLTRYSVVINCDWIPDDQYKASRRLVFQRVTSLYMVKCFSKLLKRSQVLDLGELDDTKHVVYELDKEGFVELKYLTLSGCPTVQYILHSSTSVEWVPPPNTFCMLEELILTRLDNLEAVCHGPIPMGSFGNLRILRLKSCKRLKYVFSLPTQHGRESAFPQLQHLELYGLPELISFYSTRSSGTQESMTFFSQQVAFPALESLHVTDSLHKVKALWHNQLPANSFSKLKVLELFDCDELLNVFPLSVAKVLVQLEDLQISLCKVLEAIVANENENEDEATSLFLFPRLTSLSLAVLPQLQGFCFGRFTSRWPLLKELEVYHCDKVEILFQEIGLKSELDNKIQQSLFLVEKVALPGLESLFVGTLDNIRALQLDQLPTNSFSKLRKLKVIGCNKLLNIFPVSVASALVQLEDLDISGSGVEAIVANENEDEAAPLLLFPNLTSLTLRDLHQLKRFCSGRFSSSWPLLKELEVVDCDKVEILFQQINLECELEPLFWVEQVAFPGLESLSVHRLDNIRALWPDQLPANSFSKLRKLEVSGCNKLLNPFPISVASALVQLEDLRIFSSGVEAIVANENEDEAAPLLLFPNLTSLTLRDLHQLKRFCSGRFSSSWPLLKKLEVDNCDKVEILFQQISLECELEPLFWVEKVAFPGLESLYINRLDNIRALCPDQLPANSFSKLRKLEVNDCNKLLNLFPVSVASALVQLKDLQIFSSGVEEIVTNENEDEAASLLLFPNLTSLTLRDLHQLKRFCSGRFSSSWPLLKILEVDNCDKVEILFQQISLECELEPLFWVEKVALPSLESLYINGLDNIRALCPDQLPANSFSKLRKLRVNDCNKLLNLFPVSVASTLVQLEDLQIFSSGVEAIVTNENEDEAAPLLLFPNLTSLTLRDLHQLKRFCSGRFSSSWPLLKKLEVLGCDKVEILFQQISLERELEPLFWVEQVAFPSLESLYINRLDNIRALCPNQLPANSFSKLRKLRVNDWNKLLNLFPVSVASALVQLEDLQIFSSGVEAIVTNENEDEAAPLLLFPNLTSLTLRDLHQLKRFCSGRFSSSWPLLKKLEVLGCDKVEILFQQISLECELEPLFWVEQEAFLNLEELRLSLKGTVEIWRGQFSGVSFLKLRYLKIEECQGISVVIPSNMVQILHNLKELEVKMCDSVNEVIQVEIVGNDGHELTDNEIEFTRLKSLTLDQLPNLKSFCSSTRYVFKFPSLETMKVGECRGMEFFYKGVLNTPRLKGVQNEFFEECWQDDLNTTIHKKFMEQGHKKEDYEKLDSINSDLREDDSEED